VAKAEVESIKVEEPEKNCRGLKVCEEKSIKEVTGIHLPWKTELFTTENKIYDRIEGTGGGAGWKVKCKVPILGERTDECESEESRRHESVLLENVLISEKLLVLNTFLDEAHGHCSEGGKESGETRGQFGISLENGQALTVNKE